jgi:PAS domain S-box-containing protein
MPGKQDEYRTQFENASDIMYAHDLTGAIIRVNRAFERLTGFAESELVSRNIADFVTPQSRHLVQQIINEQIGGGRLVPFELELITKQGAPASLGVSLRLIFENGMPIGIEGVGRDDCSRRRELSNPDFELRSQQNADELTRYTRYLQLLHRLSITNYDTLDALFADYLAAGCEIFGTSHGAVSQLSGDRITTRCHRSDGSAPLNDVHARRVLTQGRTLSTDEIFEAGCRHSAYVGTPLPVDGSIYGVLGFWHNNSSVSSLLPLQAPEIIEMMAKSIGIAIYQRQLADPARLSSEA